MAGIKEYKKLPGHRRYSFRKHRLWLGRDHLLAVTTRMVVEEYRRFYYRDIKAIIINKLPRWKIIIAALGILTALFLLPAFVMSGGWTIFWGILAGVSAIVFIQQLLYGTNSECYLITAVQNEKLPSLYRLRFAKKAVNRLRPLIEGTQGAISTTAILAGDMTVPDTNSEPWRLPPEPPSPAGNLRTRWHTIMFSLLLANALVTGISIFEQTPLVLILGTILFFSFLISVIITLVRQQNHVIFGPLRALTWINLGYAVIGFLAGYALFFYTVIRHPDIMEGAMGNQWAYLRALSTISLRDDPVLLYSFLLLLILDLAIGILGFLFIIRQRRMSKG